MIRPLFAALMACLLVSAAGAPARAIPPPPVDTAGMMLNDWARLYVILSLQIGEHEDGYIDAYYGPPEWQAEARAHPLDTPQLMANVDRLRTSLENLEAADWQPALTPERKRRIAFLKAQLTAARTRLRMMQGEKLSFEDEAEGLFGVRPALKPLTAYDPVLKEIEALVPGEGPLWQRVDAFNDRFIIPADRLQAVMDAAIAECRRRTMEHIALPANERFTLEFVTGKSWSGYNWYKGNATSLIQVNTDLPVRLSRAVDLGCHEGYPGHHVLNVLLEQRLTRARGWVEFSVYPLYSPQSLIAEGSANYGIALAFPGQAKTDFERDKLYPLAGLDPKTAAAYGALMDAKTALAQSEITIAAAYLDGKMTKPEAVRALAKYGLTSTARAEKRLSFIETYRSYVINYSLGQDLVRDHVERAGKSEAARWAAMERVISEPTTPADLAK